MNKVSQDFKNAVITGGCYCQVGCECGITHFMVGDDKGDYSEGELDNLLKMQETNPSKYLSTGYTIDFGYIEGKCFVIDCPCNSLLRYEQWIAHHDRIITKFLNNRIATMKKKIEETVKETSEVKQ